MAKIGFSTENKAKSDFDYPKLSLEHGERARIVCIEAEPEMEFIHTLRAPQIVNGQAVTHSVKQKDGSFRDEVKYDFVGRHLCFGNPNTLADKQKDPTNCPTCEAAEKNEAVGAATRRFAMHVVRYKTTPGGFKPQTPFQAELLAWAFTDKIFNQLVDIMEEHGDLRKKDLLLGPCENKQFQKFDIQVGGTAEWLKDPETKAFVQRLYVENKSDDLTPLISRKIGREMAEEDISKVLTRNAIAFGGGVAALDTAPDAAEVGTDMDLDSLLGGTEDKPAEKEPEAKAEEPEVDLVPDLPPGAPEVSPEEPEAVKETVPPKKEEKADDLDFDALFEGL